MTLVLVCILNLLSYTYTTYYNCILSDWNKPLLRGIYIPRVGVAMTVYGWYNIIILSCLVSSVYLNCEVHDFLYHNMDIGTMWHWSITPNYSTGVQIVSCTLSDDSVLSESTGLFNPVLCVSQWNLFWQKKIRLCLSNQVRPGREWFPSPLGDCNRLFKGLIGELFKIWHWNMFYFFKWHQSGP